MNKVKMKTYIKVYWVLWLIFLIWFILTRLFDPGVGLLVILMLNYILVLIPMGVINFVLQSRFVKHLKKYHPETWNSLLDFIGERSGVNWYHKLEFLYNPDNLNDPELERLKTSYRNSMTLTLTIVATELAMFIFFIVVYGFGTIMPERAG
jgi:hypothetical protein